MSKFYTIEEIINKEQKKIDEINENIKSNIILNPYCPGGFRRPDKYDKQLWKEQLKYSQSIIEYLSKIK